MQIAGEKLIGRAFRDVRQQIEVRVGSVGLVREEPVIPAAQRAPVAGTHVRPLISDDQFVVQRRGVCRRRGEGREGSD